MKQSSCFTILYINADAYSRWGGEKPAPRQKRHGVDIGFAMQQTRSEIW
jgi:hypothetical protein